MENLTVSASDSIYYCTSEIVINIFPNSLIYVAAKFTKERALSQTLWSSNFD